jgi:hypothetical protein
MKNQFLVWAIVCLLILNLATLTIFWLGRARTHPPSHPARASDFIIKELALNEEQKKSYLDLVSEHRRLAGGHRKNIKDAKNRFFDLLKNHSAGDSLKQAALKEISTHTEQLDLVTFDHFQKVRALCTPAQQKKFDTIIQEVLNMMAVPRPPAGGSRGGPPLPQRF